MVNSQLSMVNGQVIVYEEFYEFSLDNHYILYCFRACLKLGYGIQYYAVLSVKRVTSAWGRCYNDMS